MNNELRDPLEKLSNSLRRAVSINKSKETDLKATMNTIQRERRRSLNSWSMRQEKFLRTKQNRMPVMHFEQATLPQQTKTDYSHNTKSKERRINLVRAVDPVNMTTIDRNKSPGLKNGGRITTNKNDGPGTRKKSSALEELAPVTTLANSNLFFLERKRLHRNRHRHHFSTIASVMNCRELRDRKVMTKIERVDVENIDREGDVCPSHPKDKDFLPTIATAGQDGKRETAKKQWEKVRYLLGNTSEKRHKNKSMFELTKLFSEIRQCRYLRTGKESTSQNQQEDYTFKCTCVACIVKDKHKLKNHLSAP